MATPAIYKSSDASAPLLTSGQAYTVLKQCLVTGYGSKAGAGWTLAFDDAVNKKAVFKNVHGDCALRVDSSLSSGYSQVMAADDFSDIDTPIGAPWHGSATYCIPNFTASGNRPWVVLASDELAILISNNNGSLTDYSSGSTSAFPVFAFGRGTPLADTAIFNLMFATQGLTNSPAGTAAAVYAANGNTAVLGACSKDYLGGTSKARGIISGWGALSRYEASPGVYQAATYFGSIGAPFSTVTDIVGERLSFFREDGTPAGSIPLVLPYVRFDQSTTALNVDELLNLNGLDYTIYPIYNTASVYGRGLVPNDGW